MSKFSFSNFLAGFGFGKNQESNVLNGNTTAEIISEFSETDDEDSMTVTVRLNMEQKQYQVAPTAKISQIIANALKQFGVTVDTSTLSVLSESNNQVRPYNEVANASIQSFVGRTESAAISLERPSGTAG